MVQKAVKIILFLLLVFCFALEGSGQSFAAAETESAVVPKGPSSAAAVTAAPEAASYSFERLFDDTLTHRLIIRITRSEWKGLAQDMLDYSATDEGMRTGNYRQADLIYEDENGRVEICGIGLRTRGNTTRILPQDEEGYNRAHFTISLDETFSLEAGTDEYEVRKKREFCGLEEINLKWNRWMDFSHIRELYCYQQLAAAGLHAPRATLAALTIIIDGEVHDYGVYTMIEPIDKKFLKKRFGSYANDGNLYKCLWENCCASLSDDYPEEALGVKEWETGYRPSYDLKTNKAEADFGDIQSFIRSINDLNDGDFAAYIKQNFDIDRYLRLLAMNFLLGTPDDYRCMCNNYYLYFNNRGKIEMIPYDYDASLGGGWEGDPYLSYGDIAAADIHDCFDLSSAFLEEKVYRPLIDRIFAIDEYKRRYEYYLGYFIDSGIVSYESFLIKFDALKQLYSGYAGSGGTTDFGQTMLLDNEEWYFRTKTESVKNQLAEFR